MTRWMEREQAIMNGIMSLLVNECDALACVKKAMEAETTAETEEEMQVAMEAKEKAIAALYETVLCKVRPTLQVCAGETAQKDRDLAATRSDANALRTAVETVISNQHVAPADNDVVMQALRVAAPGHPHLE